MSLFLVNPQNESKMFPQAKRIVVRCCSRSIER